MRYETADLSLYPGRTSGENHYLRESIQFASVFDAPQPSRKGIALLGYCCDEGVRRNQGRVGAKDGPNAIRQQFGKLANHFTFPIIDFGNLICDDQNLEGFQAKLAEAVQNLQYQSYKTIVLGGGHDIAYGHYSGLKLSRRQKRIGIINFDAHLDLRTPSPEGNSGTPFYQIAKVLKKENFNYLPIGIRRESNHRGLIETASSYNTNIIYLEECAMEHFSEVKKKINQFIQKVDALYITIDLDGFSSAYAPGVSAPHPIGLKPQFVLNCLAKIFESKKVISVDFAELNPTYDIDYRTARLAASMLYQVIDFWEK